MVFMEFLRFFHAASPQCGMDIEKFAILHYFSRKGAKPQSFFSASLRLCVNSQFVYNSVNTAFY